MYFNKDRVKCIAEVGINHNGNLNNALKLIDAAKESGADTVKFQTFVANQFCSPELTFSYKSKGVKITENMLEMFERYQLSRDSWYKIHQHCKDVGIEFLSTPQNLEDLEFLSELGLNAIKIGSDDLNNIPQIAEYAQFGLPIILSSGMGDLAEIWNAVQTAKGSSGNEVCVLVCTSQYPTPATDVNIRRVTSLRSVLHDCEVGFSDHTIGVNAAVLAVSLGAIVFEKHFTLNNNDEGPDHWFSADPAALKVWVDSIQESALMLGNGCVKPSAIERENKKQWQRKIVASRDIESGEKFEKEMLTMRRVSSDFGFSASMLTFVVGLTANRNFNRGEVIVL